MCKRKERKKRRERKKKKELLLCITFVEKVQLLHVAELWPCLSSCLVASLIFPFLYAGYGRWEKEPLLRSSE